MKSGISNISIVTWVTSSISNIFSPLGSPALTGTGTIAVKVDDVNDNVPKFAFNMYSKTIPEDAPTGTDVLLVNASDSDASVNAIIRYVALVVLPILFNLGPVSFSCFGKKGEMSMLGFVLHCSQIQHGSGLAKDFLLLEMKPKKLPFL